MLGKQQERQGGQETGIGSGEVGGSGGFAGVDAMGQGGRVEAGRASVRGDLPASGGGDPNGQLRRSSHETGW